MQRREFLRATSAGAAVLAAPRRAVARQDPEKKKLRGRIRHSVCRWCYGKIALDDLCREVAAMGGHSVELLDEADWEVPKKHGLVCAVANGPGGIPKGWNRIEHHDNLVQKTEALLPKIAAVDIPNTIVFSGNRAGLADEEGAKNCITGLKRIAPLAEKFGVTLLLEILNSKVDHGDYQFDHMAYGLEVVKAVGSPRLKILYDIYHAQIMEGDVIRTIRDHIDWIGHFHTGGVPGRQEIDATQELNYAAICRAIADAGFKGFVAQEFVPAKDPLTSLRQAFEICDA
jgi:hydroxypyruvate isomerase